MKNINLTILFIYFIFTGLVFANAQPCQADIKTTELYVSPTGFDGNNGKKETPLRTLEGVKNAILQALPQSSVVVNFLDGRYEISEGFRLSKEDFGVYKIPQITFKPANNAKAILTGSIVLSSDKWQPVTDRQTLDRLDDAIENKVRFVDLREMRHTDFGLMRGVGFSEPVYQSPMELFCNNMPMNIAGWPNIGFAQYGKVIEKGATPRTGDNRKLPGKVEFDNPRMGKWVNQKDAWVQGTPAYDWADKRVPMIDVDAKNKTLTLGTNLYGYLPNKRFKVLNILEELDDANEYYIDRDAGRIYCLADTNTDKLTISILDKPMIIMEGLSNVAWEGFTFEEGRSMAILMIDCENCKVVGSIIRNFGTAAISIGEGEYGNEVGSYGYGGWDPNRGLYANTAWDRRGGKNNGIVSCDIYDIGTYGILLGGGDRKTLTPAGNYVENCDIYRTARIAWQMFPKISIDGVGNRVSNCHLHQNPHSVIMYWGNDHTIEYNEIDNCVYDSSDSGAIYTGRDPSGTGSTIKYNFIHHIKGISNFEGIFLDDGTCGQKVLGNVFYDITGDDCRGGIKYHGGQFNEAINNVFIDCDDDISYTLWNQKKWDEYLTTDMMKKRLREAVDILSEPYLSKYPKLAKIYETPYTTAQKIEIDNYSTSADDPIFANTKSMDFTITDLAKVRKTARGFEAIPFEKIGLYNDSYRTQKEKAVVFYVDDDGKATGTGTMENPFNSLKVARNAVRKINKNPDTVLIREGRYSFTETLVFDEKDSGNQNAKVIYKAYPNEKVTFTGGVKIDIANTATISDPAIKSRIIDQNAVEKILKIDLKAIGITNYGEFKSRGFRRPYKNPGMELFINDKAMQVARWPNTGFVKIGKVLDKGGVPREGDFSNKGGVFTYNYDRPAKWLKADDLYLSGNFKTTYADDTMKVAKIDLKAKTFTMAYAHLYGIDTGKPWTNYFAVNLLEEIDQPGEWYLDRTTGIAYFYPPSDNINKIEVSLLDEPMIAMEGCNYVTFEGITFEVMRDMAIYIERGHDNLIAGCTFRNIGLLAVCMGKGALAPDGEYSYGHPEGGNFKAASPISRELSELDNWLYQDTVFNRQAGYNNGILSCNMYDIGCGAVHLGGGDRITLTPGNNYVKNCEIHDFNRLDRSYKSAVNITGCGNIITHNHIYDAPDMAIYLHGNDHLIEYNHIHHVMLENNEGGWFYMGRDLSEQGIVIRYNFVHHVAVTEDGREGDRTHGAAGIYVDDNASGVEIYGNVLYKTGRDRGAILYKSSDMKVVNNIFIECQHAICARAWEFGMPDKIESVYGPDSLFAKRLFVVNYLEPPYITKYPFIADYLDYKTAWKSRRNVTENNIFVKMDEKQMFLVQNGGTVGLGENYMASEDPGFIDYKNLNFQLNDNSIAYKKLPNFERIPFVKIGLYRDCYREYTKKTD